MWARLVAFCTPLAIPGHPGKDAGLALLAAAAGQDTDSASRLCRTLQDSAHWADHSAAKPAYTDCPQVAHGVSAKGRE